MIFGNNSTTLGASSVAMAEGYNCSYGAALALVESAQNDYAMFKAMVGADFKEINICRESAGYVRESEVSALHEAVGGGIWKKICEFFKKLAAKIKGIFHNFAAKLSALWKSDKDYVKKYETEVMRKNNIGNLEVKWRKVKQPITFANNSSEYGFTKTDLNKLAGIWKEDREDRYSAVINKNNIDNISDYQEALEEEYMEDEDTLKISEIGGIRGIATYLKDYNKNISEMDKNITAVTRALEKLASEANKNANNVAKDYANKTKDASGKETSESDIETANHAYEMATVTQDVTLARIAVIQKLSTIEYKQNKAAFVKAVTANDKKLEESAAYLDAVAEAAADEVEDVISSAMSDEEISKISNASKAVKDADVNDCPNTLTYGPDYYGRNAYGPADGSVDTDINSKEESAFFGKLLY